MSHIKHFELSSQLRRHILNKYFIEFYFLLNLIVQGFDKLIFIFLKHCHYYIFFLPSLKWFPGILKAKKKKNNLTFHSRFFMFSCFLSSSLPSRPLLFIFPSLYLSLSQSDIKSLLCGRHNSKCSCHYME